MPGQILEVFSRGGDLIHHIISKGQRGHVGSGTLGREPRCVGDGVNRIPEADSWGAGVSSKAVRGAECQGRGVEFYPSSFQMLPPEFCLQRELSKKE